MSLGNRLEDLDINLMLPPRGKQTCATPSIEQVFFLYVSVCVCVFSEVLILSLHNRVCFSFALHCCGEQGQFNSSALFILPLPFMHQLDPV